MAVAVSYRFLPEDIVWTITEKNGDPLVKKGTIVRVTVKHQSSTPTITYTILLNGESIAKDFTKNLVAEGSPHAYGSPFLPSGSPSVAWVESTQDQNVHSSCAEAINELEDRIC